MIGVSDAATKVLANIYSAKIKSDADLVPLERLTRLERLYLGEKPITDAGLAHVAKLRRLKTLFLPARITDAGMAHLAELTDLEDLDLGRRRLRMLAWRTYGR